MQSYKIMNCDEAEDIVEFSTVDFNKNVEELEEDFPHLDIYNQCSSYNPTSSMAAANKPFFKDSITEQFTEGVSTKLMQEIFRNFILPRVDLPCISFLVSR